MHFGIFHRLFNVVECFGGFFVDELDVIIRPLDLELAYFVRIPCAAESAGPSYPATTTACQRRVIF